MSYDIYLRCPTCHRDPSDGEHPTYNLTPIFDLALTGEPLPNPGVGEMAVVVLAHKTDRPRGLRLLNGKKAADTIAWLEKALGHMRDPAQRAAFGALEPDNGWGTLAGACRTVEAMLANAREQPDAVWEIR